MAALAGFVAPLFWGVVVLSLLVFVHEAGHFLSARLCGMRVTEFYLGMPCRVRLSFRSRRYGTEVGVTPILLGGYTRICGMEGEDDDLLATCLASVQRQGRVAATDVAVELGIDEERAYALLATLCDWASIRPLYDPRRGEHPGQKTYPARFETLARDADMLTEYDRRHDFARAGSTTAGQARPVVGAPEELLKMERSRTYRGKGFLARAFVLVAGPLVNIALAFAIVVGSLCLAGISIAVNTNVIGHVEEGSCAAAAGLVDGDSITAVDDVATSDWNGLCDALGTALSARRDFTVTYTHGGTSQTVTVDMPEGEQMTRFGIEAQRSVVRLNVIQASAYALDYAGQVGTFALRLIMPQHTVETLQGTSSVVGVSAMAATAASEGPRELLLFIAMVSMSLGFMNLLPIPPLDGGKVLIEIIQLMVRRPIPTRVQNGISYLGLAFFLLVFCFALKNDLSTLFF